MRMKKLVSITLGMLFANSVYAAGLTTSLDFNYLNSSLTNNSLVVGISNAGVSVEGVAVGDDYSYSVEYTNSDFDGDGKNDTLNFDLLVEGFTGSLATYVGDGTSSATIGTTGEIVTIIEGPPEQGWGVNGDMSDGNTLKFTINNISSTVGEVLFDGINVLRCVEAGAYGHIGIIGEGTDLDAFSFDAETDTKTWVLGAKDPIYITGGSVDRYAEWGVGSLDLRMTVSSGKTVSAEEFANGFSDIVAPVPWDWSTIRTMRMITGRAKSLTDEAIDSIGTAGNYISVGADDETARKFSELYPNKIYGGAYMNLERDYSYDEDVELPHPEWYLYNPDGSLFLSGGTTPYLNFLIPECREWWIDSLRYQVDNSYTKVKELFIDGFAKIDAVAKDDGLFLDYDGNEIAGEYWMEGIDPLLNSLRDEFGGEVIISGNIWRVAEGNRELKLRYSLEYTNMAYLETWERGGAEDVLNPSIIDAIKMTSAGMGILINLEPDVPITRTDTLTTDEMIAKAQAAMPELWERLPEDEQLELAQKYAYFDVKLAYVLMFAEERTYFDYARTPTQLKDMGTENWRTLLPFPDWDYPLGAPLGVAVQNGNIWTRSFEFVDVTLNLNNGTAQYDYHDSIVAANSESPKHMFYYSLENNKLVVTAFNNEKISVVVFNNLGQVMLFQKGNTGKVSLDLSNINSGQYYVKISTTNYVAVESFVKK